MPFKGIAFSSFATPAIPIELVDWRRRADSNRRITDLQSAALPLGYGAASRAKKFAGAGNGIRTRDPDLGKVVLYH
jgi:hypothetical protein